MGAFFLLLFGGKSNPPPSFPATPAQGGAGAGWHCLCGAEAAGLGPWAAGCGLRNGGLLGLGCLGESGPRYWCPTQSRAGAATLGEVEGEQAAGSPPAPLPWSRVGSVACSASPRQHRTPQDAGTTGAGSRGRRLLMRWGYGENKANRVASACGEICFTPGIGWVGSVPAAWDPSQDTHGQGNHGRDKGWLADQCEGLPWWCEDGVSRSAEQPN